MSLDDIRTLILAVVRGQRPWMDLSSVGVEIEFHDGKCEMKYKKMPTVEVTAADIAFGLLHYSKEPTELRMWAAVIVGAHFIDLPDLETVQLGDTLLNALWDAAFEGNISADAINAAKVIVFSRENEIRS